MENTVLQRVHGIVAEMQSIDYQLKSIKNWNDEVGKFMIFQFVDMKRELLKELIIELIKSDTDLETLDGSLVVLLHQLAQKTTDKPLRRAEPELLFSLRQVRELVA